MEKSKIEQFKNRLEKEKAVLEEELKSVGRVNPSNPGDWEATPPGADISQADRNEVADEIEDFENNAGILKSLEIKYNEVKDALAKIENGKYGICEVCGKAIEEDRLDANQAARTCKEHMA